MKAFSVILPTYTGAETIKACLESIREQQLKKSFELIVVIDGPNKQIQDICQEYIDLLSKTSITMRVKQFKVNQGRFKARFAGAQMAKTGQLLFVDDRITFDPQYFSEILSQNEKALVSNTTELPPKNFISATLRQLRTAIYGKKNFGAPFKSFHITKENFESSPKGTAGFWVTRELFIDACEAVQEEVEGLKYVSDDTKVLQHVVSTGTPILRCSEAVIYYSPRQRAADELRHMYSRGPFFVNYYSTPGTRYFPVLMALLVAVPIVSVLIAFFPWLLLLMAGLGLGACVAAATMLKGVSIKERALFVIGLVLVAGAFFGGTLKGFGVLLIERMKGVG